MEPSASNSIRGGSTRPLGLTSSRRHSHPGKIPARTMACAAPVPLPSSGTSGTARPAESSEPRATRRLSGGIAPALRLGARSAATAQRSESVHNLAKSSIGLRFRRGANAPAAPLWFWHTAYAAVPVDGRSTGRHPPRRMRLGNGILGILHTPSNQDSPGSSDLNCRAVFSDTPSSRATWAKVSRS